MRLEGAEKINHNRHKGNRGPSRAIAARAKASLTRYDKSILLADESVYLICMKPQEAEGSAWQ